MKRILGFFFAASLPFMFASCQEETQEIQETGNTLEVTPSSVLEFSASGNDAVAVAVITDASSWDFSADEWILAEKTEDGLSVNVQDNDTGASRQGEIEITAGNAEPVSVRVTQKPEDFVELSINEITDTGTGSEYEVTVTTAGEPWTLSGGDTEEPDWCIPSATEGESGAVVTFTVASNDTESRECEYVFTSGKATAALKVTSTPAWRIEVVSPEGGKASVGQDGGSLSMRFDTNVPLEALSCQLPEDAGWITFDRKSEGLAGSIVFSFTVAENSSYDSRSAVVTVSGEGVSADVTVEQEAKPMPVRIDDLMFTEYVEGDGVGQTYIEIYNPTEEAVSLSPYSIELYPDGSTYSMGTGFLSGTLAPGEVAVFRSSTATLWDGTANVLYSAMEFDGNDAIVLKNLSTIIDVIGEVGSSETFAADKTLRRKESVTRPAAEWIPEEWDEYPANTVSGLGSR